MEVSEIWVSQLKEALRKWRPDLLRHFSDKKTFFSALRETLFEPLTPQQIEERSFKLQAKKLNLKAFSPKERVLVQRLVHATADLSLPEELLFHPEAVDKALENLRKGLDILADVEMVRAGINKRKLSRFGGRVLCYITEEEVFVLSSLKGKTRAEIAMEKGLSENIGLVVIGNAPTALIKVIELLQKSPLKQQVVVVGVPVGLVKAFEAKLFLAFQEFPFITNLSPRGGSAMAVAIVNALLGLLEEEAS